MRLAVLLITAATGLAATQDVMDVFAFMASALSEGNPAIFLRAIDTSMPGYAALARNVHALAAQNALSSSVEVVKQEGEGDSQSVELDWLLEITGTDQSHVF